MNFLNTEHCLTIAGAFIAIIGACATLVNIANSKSDALVNRYRDVTKEFREELEPVRRDQLHEQIDLYVKRAELVYRAERCLFSAIGFFIFSIAVFVVIALYLVYVMTPDDKVYSVVQPFLLALIGACVAVGATLMVNAIYIYFLELKFAKDTFDSETHDCRLDKTQPRLRKVREGYGISYPGLPDCWFQGETKEEALRNFNHVVRAHLKSKEDVLGDEVELI